MASWSHGSTYTPAGVPVFGPAPRWMDTFAFEIDHGSITVETGSITVETGSITLGSTSNASRAVLPG